MSINNSYRESGSKNKIRVKRRQFKTYYDHVLNNENNYTTFSHPFA
jgi:hypothetical protein